MAKTPEGEIVEYIKKQLKARGCLIRKIGYEMRRGCPDLLVLAPQYFIHSSESSDGCPFYRESCVIFVEVKKSEDTQPEEHQLREHARMRAVGADVRTIGSKRQVDELVKELFPCD
ncbi:VRR-NUC domain-containing protein [Salmonella enterica]|nr:VRR-NUC domain-containing protein [Salmonella enterica subsp. enterica serovar Typhimurium]EBA9759991.1 VRR-NUC domain-containing protein [Salmonella enterica]EBS8537935.1 VRR-NUC domain-containing protein [Salmonella enterica]EFT7391786.1 VRR-NUC domain-containing protein [Salmonella enterica]